MTNVVAKWDGPVALMDGKSGWGLEAWTFPSSDLGTIPSQSFHITPISHRQYKVLSKFGMIFSKEEIVSTLGERPATLVGLGFHCISSPKSPLDNYEIRVSNSDVETLFDGWPPTPEKVLIKTSIKPSTNNWIFFGPFPDKGDESFVWDGESNLYFEITWKRTSGRGGTGRGSILASTPSSYHKILSTEATKDQIMSDVPFNYGSPRPATIFKWKL